MRFPFALILLAYSAASLNLEREYPGFRATWNQALGIALAGGYIWLAFKKNRPAVLTSFFQLYSWFGMLISAFVISTGEYMTEIEKAGTANGTFWVLLVFFIGSMEMTLIGYRMGRHISVSRLPCPIEKMIPFFATTPTLFLSAYIFIRYRGPLLLGVDRTIFWGSLVPAYLNFVPNLVNQTFIFPAYAFLDARKQGKPVYFGLALLVSYMLIVIFVLGEKFTAFIVFLNAFLFVLAAKFPNIKVRILYILLAIGAVSTLLLFISYIYIRDGYGGGFALTRIALQAQLLWSSMEDGSALRLLPSDPSCFFSCGDFANGQDYISWIYLPMARYEHYTDVGSRLSGFTPALHLITLGWAITFTTLLIAAFVLGWVQRKAVVALSQHKLLFGFLCFKLHFGLIVLVSTANMVTITGIVASLTAIVLYTLCFGARIKHR